MPGTLSEALVKLLLLLLFYYNFVATMMNKDEDEDIDTAYIDTILKARPVLSANLRQSLTPDVLYVNYVLYVAL